MKKVAGMKKKIDGNFDKDRPVVIFTKGENTKRGIKQYVKKNMNWAELVDEYLPEAALLMKHAELLEAGKKVQVRDAEGKRVMMVVPDYDVQAKALDMAIKMRGKYAATEMTITARKFQTMTDEELQEEIDRKKRFFNKTENQ